MGLSTEEIRTALRTSLLGEIYPEIRAIAYAYHSEEKKFLIRYYLNREPTEDDYESVSEVMAEFISNFKHSEFDILKEECRFSNLPKSKLDPLDGFVYSKKRRDDLVKQMGNY
ncbi:hypothetical protein L0P88_08865 [Muricauda sp. SCSIO 64092]|uniref:hypothetical protein n=1 Tax=Allomuricauda sp. SCSIO 64092 TaxID=2908842 RepID=UPI001FF60AD7|nr:hypothetical protein [Muricauda sp. SCSIO 64092]UOY08650.1 hypothetical protein L0P88_08865 [Muricauda sp. SCSIO 64092]